MELKLLHNLVKNSRKLICNVQKINFATCEEMIKIWINHEKLFAFKRIKMKDSRIWIGSGATVTKGGTSPRRIVGKLWHVYERVARGQRAKKHYRKISGVQLMPWVLITQRGYSPQALSDILSRFERQWKTATRRVFDYIEFNNLRTPGGWALCFVQHLYAFYS